MCDFDVERGQRPASAGVLRFPAYRTALSQPGQGRMLGVTWFVRMPATVTALVFTLYLVVRLHSGFGAGGLVVAAVATGSTVGGLAIGRLIDHVGLPAALPTAIRASCAFWLVVSSLSYDWLLLAVTLSGAVYISAAAVTRQGLAALLPPYVRTRGFALDSVLCELSHAVGLLFGATTIVLPRPRRLWRLERAAATVLGKPTLTSKGIMSQTWA